MKKYTRKGLIRFFEKLPPRSRPCKEACPIAVFLGAKFIESRMSLEAASIEAMEFDPILAERIDLASVTDGMWPKLTAAQIVKIAKAAPHV